MQQDSEDIQGASLRDRAVVNGAGQVVSALRASVPSVLAATVKEIDCPRCWEQCGWCSDPRHMHGKLPLPGTRRKCEIARMHPDAVCPLCEGSMRVIATTTYTASVIEARSAETAGLRPQGESAVGESRDAQPIAAGDNPND